MTDGFYSNLIPFLSSVTNGVRTMSKDIPELVQTSSNLGIIPTEEDKIVMTFSLRSSVEKEKSALHNEIESLAKQHNAKVASFVAYPAWEYKKNSKLQGLCREIYRE